MSKLPAVLISQISILLRNQRDDFQFTKKMKPCLLQEHEKLHKIVADIESLTRLSEKIIDHDSDHVHDDVVRKAKEMQTIAERMSKFLR